MEKKKWMKIYHTWNSIFESISFGLKNRKEEDEEVIQKRCLIYFSFIEEKKKKKWGGVGGEK